MASPDFFTDASLCADPYTFFESLRAKGPVHFEPHHGVAIVTGLEEAIVVCNDPTESFSACNASSGPLPPLPFKPEGDDISGQIERHRGQMPSADLLVTYDRPEHPLARGLLMHLFTPRRLKENEEYLWRLCDQMIEQILRRGAVEAVSELGSPYATLVITDLLGIPQEDRDTYRNRLTSVVGPIGDAGPDAYAEHPLEFLHESFTRYIEQRRAVPLDDVLTQLAGARYPDGSLPSVLEVVRVAVNLYAAGQETTARLLATTLRILAEQPDIQQQLREQPDQVPKFVEEALRLEGPVKGTFRLTRKTTKIGDVVVKAGTTVMMALAAINRDPRLYESPDSIDMNRPKLREHLAFGRGKHTCPGASLARVEVRAMLERLLARTKRIGISAAHHGAPGSRRFDYAPTYMLRGLNALHLEIEA
jgi:cytochrome P450 family 150 subfamily A5